jgi:hypothetical protein
MTISSEHPDEAPSTSTATRRPVHRAVRGREVELFDELLLIASIIALVSAIVLYIAGALPVLASILVGLAIGVGPLVVNGIEERHGHVERAHSQLKQAAAHYGELVRDNTALRAEVGLTPTNATT